MKQIIKTFSFILVSLSALLFVSGYKDDLRPQEQEMDFSVSRTPPQAQIKRKGQMVTTQLLTTGQEVECPRPTRYSVSFAYDETVGTLLFLGKSVQNGASIPLVSLANLSLTYQVKELVGNKVKMTVTNDAPKVVSKGVTWTINADDIYSVETSQGGEGELVVRGTKSLQRVPAGTELMVLATPAGGWELVALTANDMGILKSKTFEVAGNTTVRATFTKRAPTAYAATLTKEGEGKVATSGADNLGTVVAGTKLTVAAAPAGGWGLVAPTTNGADILSSKTFVVYNPTEVRVTFTKKALTTYAVTLTKESEGKVVITGADNLGTARAGIKLTVTATPASGWELTALTANGTDILSSKIFVMYNPTEVRVTLAKRASKTYGVTLTKEGESKVVITGADNLSAVRAGTRLTVATILAIGWGAKSITANGKDIAAEKSFVVTGNTIVKVAFVTKAYPVTLTREGDGRAFILETDNSGAVALGSKLTIIAEPYPGWDVKGITANGKDITTDKAFVVNGAADVNVVFYKVLESRIVVRYDPTEIVEMSLNDLPPLMTSDGPGLHTISVRMGDGVKLSIKAKDGYRITFVASDPPGLLRLTRRASSEVECLINTSKHQEVEVLIHCTRQS